MIRSSIIKTPIETSELWQEISRPENGALLLFQGITRNHHQGKSVLYLEYQCYEAMASAELQKLTEEIAAKFELKDFIAIHRIGRVEIGESSLAVAAGSPHRKQTFDAITLFIDRLKQDIPIWKRECFGDGTVAWVEGTNLKPSS